MARLEAAMAWFFSCLGVVLLGGSILVVPANAFADTGTPDCATQCGTDTSCMQTCCQNACNGDQTCYNNCMAQLPKCSGGSASCSKLCGVNAIRDGCVGTCDTQARVCYNCVCEISGYDSQGKATSCDCL